MPDKNSSLSAAEKLPFTEFQSGLDQAILKLSNGRTRNCRRNAIRLIKQAWLLQSIDPQMAVFSAITGEEESASALMGALKEKQYPGAKK